MKQKLKRSRQRQTVLQRVEINLDGIELGLSRAEVLADLDFGVGPIRTREEWPADAPSDAARVR